MFVAAAFHPEVSSFTNCAGKLSETATAVKFEGAEVGLSTECRPQANPTQTGASVGPNSRSRLPGLHTRSPAQIHKQALHNRESPGAVIGLYGVRWCGCKVGV
jgi:hypothetical protein